MTRAIGLAVLAMVVFPASTTQRVRVSPHETHAFAVDDGHITFNYGRPSKRERTIWGRLVPWGRWWMPGADEATIITTDRPLTFGKLTMPAGDHTLYMWPDEKASTLIISNEVGQFHTVYHPQLDLGRVELTMTKLAEAVEMLTLTAEPRQGGGGVLKLTWDDRTYSVDFVVGKAPDRAAR